MSATTITERPRLTYLRWIPGDGGKRIHLDINGNPRSHKEKMTKARGGSKRPTSIQLRKEIRREKALEQQARRDALTDQQQYEKLVAAGHGHCREALRLAAAID